MLWMPICLVKSKPLEHTTDERNTEWEIALSFERTSLCSMIKMAWRPETLSTVCAQHICTMWMKEIYVFLPKVPVILLKALVVFTCHFCTQAWPGLHHQSICCEAFLCNLKHNVQKPNWSTAADFFKKNDGWNKAVLNQSDMFSTASPTPKVSVLLESATLRAGIFWY